MQSREFYKALNADKKKMLINNIVESLMFAEENIQIQAIKQFYGIDRELGKLIKEGVALKL